MEEEHECRFKDAPLMSEQDVRNLSDAELAKLLSVLNECMFCLLAIKQTEDIDLLNKAKAYFEICDRVYCERYPDYLEDRERMMPRLTEGLKQLQMALKAPFN